jgi:hypothetical protein
MVFKIGVLKNKGIKLHKIAPFIVVRAVSFQQQAQENHMHW